MINTVSYSECVGTTHKLEEATKEASEQLWWVVKSSPV